jgi:hypothetical protein
MQKETLTLSHVIEDFQRLAKLQFMNMLSWRFVLALLLFLLSALLGFSLQNIFIALGVLAVGIYHVVRFLTEYRKYRRNKAWISQLDGREDVCISIEKFSHIAYETIYEPRMTVARPSLWRSNTTKEVPFCYFLSGVRWRIPDVNRHYAWSRDYYVTTAGLNHISLVGDEFIYVSLKEDADVSYAYPCKSFVLAPALCEKVE